MGKKRNEIAGILLKSLVYGGAVTLACASPTFTTKVVKALIKQARKHQIKVELRERQCYDSFRNLRKQGMLEMNYRGKQLHIRLTKEGKKKHRQIEFDEMKIKKAAVWDKRWRILIFDIIEREKMKREALRGKLKELGLYQLQKSVWVCPYNFFDEIKSLRAFFGLKNDELRIISDAHIEDDCEIRSFYDLKA